MMKCKSKPNRFGKKVLACCLGFTLACSVALSSFVASPGDLFGGISQAAPIVAAAPETKQAKCSSETQYAASARKERLRDRLRRFFLSQTSVLQGILLLPFWIAGKTTLFLLNLFFPALGTILQPVLGVFFHAALLFGLFLLICKLLFPNVPFRKFFTKRNVLLLFVSAAVLGVADAILRAQWEDYRPIRILIQLCLAGLVFSLLCWRILNTRKASAQVTGPIASKNVR